MNEIQNKKAIQADIQHFANKPLRAASLQLFATLGYASNRTIPSGSISAFCTQFDPKNSLEHAGAMKSEWKSIELLFQLTDEELSRNIALFQSTSVKASLLQSYVFFAIELTGKDYTRGQLATMTRQLNRLFPMPVMILFKISDKLSIAVINRRLHKRDESKDVLGKVTLIQNIALASPHPGHIDILASFSSHELAARKKLISNFDQLHAAWEEIFNVEVLNKRFYEELSNWYFWARSQVRFPSNVGPDELQHNSTGVIRLLTRLIFCWFLKEKGLIPESLFDQADMEREIMSLGGAESTYYRAILQNLFFATLNQPMKNSRGKVVRQFAEDVENESREHGSKNLYRYKEVFKDSSTALALFEDIPFLNGGLFTCLDAEEIGARNVDTDGFSRDPARQAAVPNELFFGASRTLDLSGDYGEAKKKKAQVRGLLLILQSYKFTIAENTPIEQEIALDPELLGKVFENLLASYNPETGTTARKQTGSFYTPRHIVEYMVDESLKAYLLHVIAQKLPGLPAAEASARLDILFAYTERQHGFSDLEVDILIAAIDHCNILDPACGSGAFPMGILHKLVAILGKLDPRNEKWRARQIEKAEEIEDAGARDSAVNAILRDFTENGSDYGRKLYLIENCIYGVDIQPIAIQISKLRFFVSLICDQKTNRDKSKNHGVRPLPNLETKFVAANTLASLSRTMQQNLFANPKIEQLERDLEKIRHRYFSAQTRPQKRALRVKDEELCRTIITELQQTSFSNDEVTLRVASWNPYDQYAAADFFDPAWMFGPSVAQGFDIIIGNPPYLKERDNKTIFETVTREEWGKKYHEGKMDYWFFFLHRALQLTKDSGIISFITSSYWLHSAGSKKLVRHIRESASLFHVVDIGALTVFEQVAGNHMLHFYRVRVPQSECLVKKLESSLHDLASSVPTERLHISSQTADRLFNARGEIKLYHSDIVIASPLILCDRFEVGQGVVQNPDRVSAVMTARYGLPRNEGVFVLNKNELSTLALTPAEYRFVKPFYGESSVAPFWLNRNAPDALLYLTKRNCPSVDQLPNIARHLSRYRPIMDGRRETIAGSIAWFQLHWPREERYFESPKVVLPSMFKTPRAAYVPEPAYFGMGSNVVIGGDAEYSLVTLSALLNSSVGAWWFATNSKKRGVGVDVGVDRLRQFPLPCAAPLLGTIEALAKWMIAVRQVHSPAEMDVTMRFLHDVIDACVLEAYFPVHMEERRLCIVEHVDALVASLDTLTSQPGEYVAKFHAIANASAHPIRNVLMRIPVDSPELLAVIQQEALA